MFYNDNTIKDSCCGAELQRILNGYSSGNQGEERRAPELDLPSCEGNKGGWGLSAHPLAMVYSPVQEFDRLYDLDKGFVAGTIFADLDLPFSGRSLKYKGNSGGCYDK